MNTSKYPVDYFNLPADKETDIATIDDIISSMEFNDSFCLVDCILGEKEQTELYVIGWNTKNQRWFVVYVDIPSLDENLRDFCNRQINNAMAGSYLETWVLYLIPYIKNFVEKPFAEFTYNPVTKTKYQLPNIDTSKSKVGYLIGGKHTSIIIYEEKDIEYFRLIVANKDNLDEYEVTATKINVTASIHDDAVVNEIELLDSNQKNT